MDQLKKMENGGLRMSENYSRRVDPQVARTCPPNGSEIVKRITRGKEDWKT